MKNNSTHGYLYSDIVIQPDMKRFLTLFVALTALLATACSDDETTNDVVLDTTPALRTTCGTDIALPSANATDGVVVYEDKISSLRRFKDDVREVAAGYECGVGLEKFNDIKVGDVLEAFIMEEVKQ